MHIHFKAFAEAVSQDCDFTWIAFVATFLQNRLCQRESSVSDLQSIVLEPSPVSITSCAEAQNGTHLPAHKTYR